MQPPIPRLTEKEFRMFMRPRRRHTFVFTALYILGTCAVMAIAFFALNAAAFLRTEPLQSNVAIATPVPTIVATPQASVTATSLSTPTPQPTPVPQSLPNNTVSYVAENISAPVTWDTAFTTADIDNNLENGVIQLSGTPHPGQQGMTIIFGHSSNYPWAKGNYKNIFAPLLKSQVGDTLDIEYNNTDYTYKVTKTYTVEPTDLGVLNSPTNQNGVRLITCSPVGTSLHRFVVEATQISPDPAKNSSYQQHAFTGSLPSDT